MEHVPTNDSLGSICLSFRQSERRSTLYLTYPQYRNVYDMAKPPTGGLCHNNAPCDILRMFSGVFQGRRNAGTTSQSRAYPTSPLRVWRPLEESHRLELL